MAKRTNGGLARHGLGNIWGAWLTSALLVVPGSDKALRAADAVASASSSSNAAGVSLEYQETEYGISSCGSMAARTSAFKKEPAAVSGKIVRGVLHFGADASNSVPFLWQCDAGKLFLDLNRNQDLTDDPAGVFETPPARPVYYQTFTKVHLLFNTSAGRHRVLADISFYGIGAQPSCFLTLHSFWQGKLTLQGRDWQVGLVQNEFDPGSFENSRLLLRPWEKRNQSFNADDGSLACVPFSRNLFVDGHAYYLECVAGSQNGEARPALKFTEQSVPLGQLVVTGQFIGRLVLNGGSWLVVLDEPAGVVKIPTGSYSRHSVQIEHDGAAAFCNPPQAQASLKISVDDKTPVILNVGGPLTNSVVARPHGQELAMDYRLIGGGGETYQLVNQDRSKPPTFAIYKGGKKLASGAFEFG